MGSSSASRRRQQNGSRQQDTQGTRGPGDDLNCLQPTSDVPSSFVTMCDENPALALERSAKTTVVRDIIIETLREHPNDKLIGMCTLFCTLNLLCPANVSQYSRNGLPLEEY